MGYSKEEVQTALAQLQRVQANPVLSSKGYKSTSDNRRDYERKANMQGPSLGSR